MTAQEFHVGDILSITTDRLVSPRHMDGVYEILNHMTGDNLMTHQLPRASREAAPSLREQFPDLAEVKAPNFREAADPAMAVRVWLEGVVAVYGETRLVDPLSPDDHTVIDPVTEMKMLRPDLDPIVVDLREEKGGG